MGGLEFIASIIRSLAWPLVILASVAIFRKAIEGRILSILKISHKDTEVVFDHTAKEVKALIAIEKPPGARPEIASNLSPNITKIAVVWAELEGMVRQRLSRAGFDVSSLGAAAAIQAAQEHKLLTDEQARALIGLNAMRNLAVHGRDDEINDERLVEFVALADAMKAVLAIT